MGLAESWRLILDHLRQDPSTVTDAKTVASRFPDIKYENARQILHRMRKLGVIERTGPRRGLYRLVTKEGKRGVVDRLLDDFLPLLPGYHAGPFLWWWVCVPGEWVRRLSARVIQAQTGCKQIGDQRVLQSPCSAQFYRNGSVRVYPRKGVPQKVWRTWLQRQLVQSGWSMEEAKAFDMQLRFRLENVEIVGPQLSREAVEALPEAVSFSEAGITVRFDCSTPKPRTAEASVDLRQLSSFLGLDRIHEIIDQFAVAQKHFGDNLESHISLVKELRSESVTNRAYIENAMKDLDAHRSLMERTAKLLEQLENK